MIYMQYSQTQIRGMFVKQSRVFVSFLIVLGSSANIACDTKKKPKTPPTVTPAGGSNPQAPAAPTPNPPPSTEEEKESKRSTSDVSKKLTSSERSLLGNFACKNKDATSKFVRLSKMINAGDRSAIDAATGDFDEDKVKALIKLAEAVEGSDSKAKATLKAICAEDSTKSGDDD